MGRPRYAERQRAAESLARTAAEVHARGWCLGTSGNFSAVLTRDPLRLLVTASGLDKSALTPDDFVLVDEAGQATGDEPGRASAEAPLHAAVALHCGAGAVLHTHSVAGTLVGEHFLEKGGLGISGYEMLKGLRGVATHEASEFVPVVANSQNITGLGEEVAALFREHPGMHGFLIAGHGLYTWGTDLEEARRHVEILEFLFELVSRRTPLRPFTG